MPPRPALLQSHRPAPPLSVLRLLMLLGGLLALGSAWSRQDAAPVRAELASFLQQQTRSLAGEVRIEVGEFAPDNGLAPCARLEAFLPPGARAWGRVTAGIRCLAPTPWSAFVPAYVRVTGPYLVTTGPVGAGQVLAPGDVRVEIGEVSALPGDVLTDPVQAAGQIARLALAAQRPLVASLLRAPVAVAQGQPVKVVTRGPGFQVANDGTALSSGSDGQPVQVRLGNGQVVRGTARAGGYVEIALP